MVPSPSAALAKPQVYARRKLKKIQVGASSAAVEQYVVGAREGEAVVGDVVGPSVGAKDGDVVGTMLGALVGDVDGG